MIGLLTFILFVLLAIYVSPWFFIGCALLLLAAVLAEASTL